MADEDVRSPEEHAADARADQLRAFWLQSVEHAVAHGFSERETSSMMLAVASAHVGKHFGPQGAVVFLTDQVAFFRNVLNEHNRATVEAELANRH